MEFVFSSVANSSNINEVIRAILNSLFFFYKNISHAPKAKKAQKAQKAQKALKDSHKRHSGKSTKTLREKHKTQKSEWVTIFPLDDF